MFTHAVSPDQLAAYKAFLNVRIASSGVFTPATDRMEYFSAQVHQGYIFLDPDTGIKGIKLDPIKGANAAKYILGPELVELCQSEPGRLVLVFFALTHQDAPGILGKAFRVYHIALRGAIAGF